MSFNIPNVFIAGKKAVADEVNENFETIKDEINSQQAKIATLGETVEEFNKSLNGGLRDELTTLIKNSKSLFCANKGNVDSEGDADLLTIDNLVPNQIVFKVSTDDGDFTPLYLTNVFGTSVIKTTSSSINMNDKVDGLYIVYAKIDGEPYATISTLTKSKKKPEMEAGDVWLDISGNPIVAKTYNGISYSDFKDIPIGEAVIEDGVLVSVKTYPYNQNGFDINAQTTLRLRESNLATSIFRSHTPDYPKGRVMANDIEHVAESDAFLVIQTSLFDDHSAILYIDGAEFKYKTTASYNACCVPIKIAKGSVYKGEGSMTIYYIEAIG